ncbi:DMT family transporter [Bacillus sp. CGMCC 1.16607]|uniref:DMT family transporter n=1 Tax=Bacillus sp. CGMCC 1.16607 TaxID=3351842 RepID=UPI00362D145C
MKKSGLYIVYIFAILNASIVGLSFLFTKTAIMISSPLDTLAFRFTISFFALLILALLKVVKINISLMTIKKLIPLALFYPTLFFSFQAFGLKYSPSSEGGILFATTPIITAIFASYFLKEKTNYIQKLSILLSVFGVIFIFIMKGRSIDLDNLLGISLLLLSCLSISGYTVMARSLAKDFKPLDITFFMLGLGLIFFNGMAIINHLNSGTLVEFVAPWSNMKFVISIVFLGIFASLVTSLLSNFILSKISASQMSVFSNLSTIVSIIVGAIFLNETIHLHHIVGSIFIILGVVGTNYFGNKKEKLKGNNCH